MFREPDPAWVELATQLRAGNDEAEITESETEQGRRRRRTLADLWTQAMHRGDRVTVGSRAGTLSGRVDFVGRDYATVVTSDLAWDVVLDRATLRTHPSPTGGHTVSGGSRTFAARLAEYEATEETVDVIAPALEVIATGRIVVAATDHVTVAGPSGELTIPRVAIDAIRRER